MSEFITYDSLKSLIAADIASKQGKYTARCLYYYKPENEDRSIFTYSNGKIHDIKKQGNRIYVNYFKQLVTQKIDYLMSDPIAVDKNLINYNINIDDLMDQGILNASLDSIAWCHLYIDDNATLQWIFVPDLQIIPIYDEYKKNIIQIIRYYSISKDKVRIEMWTDKDVTFYTINDTSKNITDCETRCHYLVSTTYNGQVEGIEYKSLGFIPFIPLWNNKDHTDDAEDIECLIKVYNSIASGFIDNIDLFQEAIIKLSGWDGDRGELKEFMDNIKRDRIVGIPKDSDGDMEYMKVEIPVEARTVILNILKDAIYTIGRGMDPSKLGDGNITNVVIKSRYQQLDFKASDCEKRARVFYQTLISKINSYYNSNLDPTIKFQKIMIINESETIKDCVASVGLISTETILEQHPFVTDVKLELKRLETEAYINDNKKKDMV